MQRITLEKLAMEAYYKHNSYYPTIAFPLWKNLSIHDKRAWKGIVKEVKANLKDLYKRP